LADRDTDFRRPDVSVVVDNLNSMTISDFKKQAKQKCKKANEHKKTEVQDSKNNKDNDTDKDVSELNALMCLTSVNSDNKVNDKV
ncbi:hypothetical protein WH47_04485, partial [Habropoda laboriosa]